MNRLDHDANTSLWSTIKSSLALAAVAGMMLLVPLLAFPATSKEFHGAKTVAFELGVVLLAASALWRLRDSKGIKNVLAFLKRGPNPWMLALAGLGAISFALASNKGFAFTGMLQLAGGVFVAMLIAFHLRARRQYHLLVDSLIIVTIVASLAGFANFGQGGIPEARGTFNDHQLFGAFLMLMLPFMVMIGFGPTTPARRMSAQTAAVLCASCLMLARARSSWIGEGVALIIMMVLAIRYIAIPRAERDSSTGAKRQKMISYVLPAVIIACSLCLFTLLSGQGGQIGLRARSLTSTVTAGQDNAVQSRLATWQGDLKMIEKRPLTGWGIGSYSLHQTAFTHTGRSQAEILASGPTLSEQAHDFYLQLTAELGLPGLLLWLGFLTAFFITGLRTVSRLPAKTLRQRLVIAGLAAVAGQMIDALGNPAWQFGEVSLFFWVIVGIALGASGLNEHLPYAETSGVSSDRLPLTAHRIAFRRLAQCAAVTAIALVAMGAVLKDAYACCSPCYPPTHYRCCWDQCGSNSCGSSCTCKHNSPCQFYCFQQCGNGPWQPCTPCSWSIDCGNPPCKVYCGGNGHQNCGLQYCWNGSCTFTCTFPDKSCQHCTVNCSYW